MILFSLTLLFNKLHCVVGCSLQNVVNVTKGFLVTSNWRQRFAFATFRLKKKNWGDPHLQSGEHRGDG